MNRRHFISTTGSALLSTTIPSQWLGAQESKIDSGTGISWRRHEASKLFDRVALNGKPLLDPKDGVGLLDSFAQLLENGQVGAGVILGCAKPRGTCGSIQVSLSHTLRQSTGGSKEDLLEATLVLHNSSDRSHEVLAGFLTSVRPRPDARDEQIYIPLSAAGLRDPEDDKRKRFKDCRQTVGSDGFVCHYLEPQASDPRTTTTRAALLAPVLDILSDAGPCNVALFGVSTEPLFFEALRGSMRRGWRMGQRVRLEPGQSRTIRTFLLLHSNDASEAWTVFHRFGHREDYPAIAWPRDMRVHYFDFLSAALENGRRGEGYDLDLKQFKEFRVGMATQHGYYLSYGDFVHPDRKEWQAMPKDEAGPVPMSLQKIRDRVEATRRAGVHPAIYMHYTILDEGSPLFEKMKDSMLLDASGKATAFGWEGPDVIKKTWRMSHTSPQWRNHLLQQAQWIMELFNPDAIVLDETFTAWGWDHHKTHGGPLSQGGIELMRSLRSVVRSFGQDKALFASDCSMANFCLWGDGEGGDHCYDRLLGHELYRKPPVRYLAALGNKAWLPCAWLYKTLWPDQVDLARKTHAAVGVTNGWGDGFGLARLPLEAREQMLRDIKSLG